MRNATKTWLVIVFLAAAKLASAEQPSIEGAWARATPPGARTGAVYLTLRAEVAADRLIGAASPGAREVQIHTHVSEGGMHRMVQLPGLEVPKATTVQFQPGGLHLMLLDLTAPLEAGQQLPLTLDFETAGRVELLVPVVDARTSGPGHGAH
jgi:copper(I)-binding protein